MNSLSIIGRVGGNAEVRKAGNYDVVNFSIAWTDPRGQKETTWFNVSLFGDRFAKLAPYIMKGDQIAVQGSVKLRKYTTRDGAEGSSLELNGENVTLLSNNRGNGGSGGGSSSFSDDAADDGGAIPF